MADRTGGPRALGGGGGRAAASSGAPRQQRRLRCGERVGALGPAAAKCVPRGERGGCPRGRAGAGTGAPRPARRSRLPRGAAAAAAGGGAVPLLSFLCLRALRSLAWVRPAARVRGLGLPRGSAVLPTGTELPSPPSLSPSPNESLVLRLSGVYSPALTLLRAQPLSGGLRAFNTAGRVVVLLLKTK